jgi:hypothetical protein
VSGVRLHEGARPKRLPDFPGHDAERETGPGPRKAAVSTLSAAPSERGMRGCGQGVPLPSRGLRQTTSRDIARDSEGREAFPTRGERGPTGRAGGHGSLQDSRGGKAAQRPTGGPGHGSWRLGGSDRSPQTRGARAAMRW